MTSRHEGHSPHPPFGQTSAAENTLAASRLPEPGGPTKRKACTGDVTNEPSTARTRAWPTMRSRTGARDLAERSGPAAVVSSPSREIAAVRTKALRHRGAHPSGHFLLRPGRVDHDPAIRIATCEGAKAVGDPRRRPCPPVRCDRRVRPAAPPRPRPAGPAARQDRARDRRASKRPPRRSRPAAGHDRIPDRRASSPRIDRTRRRGRRRARA